MSDNRKQMWASVGKPETIIAIHDIQMVQQTPNGVGILFKDSPGLYYLMETNVEVIKNLIEQFEANKDV